MSRRRHSDSYDGGQDHKRRRTSEPTEIEDSLESLICNVGEKVMFYTESDDKDDEKPNKISRLQITFFLFFVLGNNFVNLL
uniref:Uncharacterized protein n=1 Tax=Hippocampus comes TaxID=109280 RepID=A0A3Q2YQ06_HIPCM